MSGEMPVVHGRGVSEFCAVFVAPVKSACRWTVRFLLARIGRSESTVASVHQWISLALTA